MWADLCCRYCLLSRSSLRVSESQLTNCSPEAYATMSDDLIMVHAAVELGRKVSGTCPYDTLLTGQDRGCFSAERVALGSAVSHADRTHLRELA